MNSLKKKRMDSSGIQIIKGQKAHKITFKEQPDLVKTTVVDNWKVYNVDLGTKGCHCVIQ